MKLKAGRLEFSDVDAAVDLVYEKGWTDGLPVVLPTERRVREVIEYLNLDPQHVVGKIPPRGGIATVEKIAINSVMGGCRPEYVPVVLAAIEAMLEDEFNLFGVQTTDGPPAPLVIVGGPIVDQIGMNYGDGVFGGGSRANAAIGRAVRLIMWNIGGAYPGDVDKTPQGHPGKYAYCIAEYAEANPWEPLHVSHGGLEPEGNAVTVFGCEAPHGVFAGPGDAEVLLNTIAHSMSTMGSNNAQAGGQCLVVFGARGAAVADAGGFKRRDVQQYLFEKARIPLGILKQGPRAGIDSPHPFRLGESGRLDAAPDNAGSIKAPGVREALWPEWLDSASDDTLVPVFTKPEDILITVAGAWDALVQFCSICHGWGYMGGFAQTKRVVLPTA